MNITWGHGHGAPQEAWTDPAFPAGRALLDAALVGEWLAVTLPERPADPRPRLDNVYYYPGRSLEAVYVLADGTVVAARTVPMHLPFAVADGEIPMPALRAVFRVFPDDPGLPTLRSVVAAAGPRPDVLSYLPGLRCALGTAGQVAKVSTAERVVAHHRAQQVLWQAAAADVPMPRPLAVDPARAVRWESRMHGRSVESWLVTGSPDRLAAALASTLAALHSTVLPAPLPARGAPDVLGRLERKTARTVRRALPALAPRVDALVAVLRDSLPANRPAVTVHGDLHTANVLIDDGGVILLDLDELARGDAAYDLALFGTRVLLVALHRGTGTGDAFRLLQALPGAYAEATGDAIPADVYAWYVATCLVGRQVKTSIRHLAPRLGMLAGTLVSLAEVLADARAIEAVVTELHRSVA